jgi:hypothetical protein
VREGLKLRTRQGLFWQAPTRSRGAGRPASSARGKGAGSTPHSQAICHSSCPHSVEEHQRSGSSSTSSSASTAKISSTPLIQIEHILYQEPLGPQRRDEELVDPLSHPACPPEWSSQAQGQHAWPPSPARERRSPPGPASPHQRARRPHRWSSLSQLPWVHELTRAGCGGTPRADNLSSASRRRCLPATAQQRRSHRHRLRPDEPELRLSATRSASNRR